MNESIQQSHLSIGVLVGGILVACTAFFTINIFATQSMPYLGQLFSDGATDREQGAQSLLIVGTIAETEAGKVEIDFLQQHSGAVELIIYTMAGKQIYAQYFPNKMKGVVVRHSVSGLEPGIYAAYIRNPQSELLKRAFFGITQ
ncbi:MAG: hypothetical protein OCD01_15120 [Fibrobacterales bacterium]